DSGPRMTQRTRLLLIALPIAIAVAGALMYFAPPPTEDLSGERRPVPVGQSANRAVARLGEPLLDRIIPPAELGEAGADAVSAALDGADAPTLVREIGWERQGRYIMAWF